jgi:hypothetical protein
MITSTSITVSALAWSLLRKRLVGDAPTTAKSLTYSKVIRGCVTGLNSQASQQALPNALSDELRALLISSTHRIAKAREMASKYLNRLITSFPSLMCDPPLVFAILEVLTMLRRSCENEFTDEVCSFCFFCSCGLNFSRSIIPSTNFNLKEPV